MIKLINQIPWGNVAIIAMILAPWLLVFGLFKALDFMLR